MEDKRAADPQYQYGVAGNQVARRAAAEASSLTQRTVRWCIAMIVLERKPGQ